MINKYHTYRNYYKYKAYVYNVPNSFNRLGMDVYPRYFVRPVTLLEVMAYSRSPKSVDDGFDKDIESGLYLKNRLEINDTIPYEEIEIQFEFIKTNPPFWFSSQETYAEFAQTNMNRTLQAEYENMYVSAASKIVVVDAGTNSEIPVDHSYKEVTQWTTREFRKPVAQAWPIEKGVIISKVN